MSNTKHWQIPHPVTLKEITNLTNIFQDYLSGKMKEYDNPNDDENCLRFAVSDVTSSLNSDCLGEHSDGLHVIQNEEEIIRSLLKKYLPCLGVNLSNAWGCDDCKYRYTCFTDEHPNRRWIINQIRKGASDMQGFDQIEKPQVPVEVIDENKRKLSKALGIDIK